MIYKFTIPGIPQPKQSARHRVVKTKAGKVYSSTYQTKKVKKEEGNIRALLVQQLPPDWIPIPADKAIEVVKLHFIFPMLKSFSKKKKNWIKSGVARIYKLSKPDLTDNLPKILFDAMQGIIYMNDSQVVSEGNIKKYYGVTPKIEIELKVIDEIEFLEQ